MEGVQMNGSRLFGFGTMIEMGQCGLALLSLYIKANARPVRHAGELVCDNVTDDA
jgi:hypothetical protein